MKISTALNRVTKAIQRSRDTISSAKHFGSPSQELHAALRQHVEAMGKDCPGWARYRVQGYQECLLDQLYQDSLVFGVYIGGNFVSVDRNRDDYYEKVGFTPAVFAEASSDPKVARGHYWVTTEPPKPYFIGGGK